MNLRKLFRSEAANGYLLLSPTAIFSIVVMAAPLIAVVLFSFMTAGYLKIIWTPTWANYATLIEQPIYGTLMIRSLIVAAIATAATVFSALPIAYFISFFVPPERKSLWLFLITIPFWTSYLIRVFLWKVILGYNGVINSAFLGLGIIHEPMTFLLYNANAVVITLAHAYAPFAILPIFVSLEKIDRSLLEAGQDLGESRFMTFIRVTLPLAVPGVVASVLIVFIPTVGDYVTPTLVGGNGGQMVANLIQNSYFKLGNYPLGSAISVAAMAIVTVICLIFLFLNRRFLRSKS
jgi:spermidine/putrescine transport system permease protein